MNSQIYDDYLETLASQLADLQKALLPYVSMDEDEALMNQLALQGWINQYAKLRFQIINGAIHSLLIVSAQLEADINSTIEKHKEVNEDV